MTKLAQQLLLALQGLEASSTPRFPVSNIIQEDEQHPFNLQTVLLDSTMKLSEKPIPKVITFHLIQEGQLSFNLSKPQVCHISLELEQQ